jgi:hypothetical protein
MSSSIETEQGGIRPPFAAWKPRQRRWAFVATLVLTLFVGMFLARFDASLQNETAPMGIISYEFARTTAQAEAILASWEEVRDEAWAIMILDFAWMFMYATNLALGCAMAGSAWARIRPGLATPFAVIAWMQFLAILFDGIENTALTWMLYADSGAQPAPFIAWAAAIPKFAIVFVGIPATLSGIIPWLMTRK